mmetsp:Transcript_27435/g.88168  ORF Transcript_27435/g.88168 Transcript_27435/m.88168 type:complete len:167 (+) Transcript_27435:51-551(+)
MPRGAPSKTGRAAFGDISNERGALSGTGIGSGPTKGAAAPQQPMKRAAPVFRIEPRTAPAAAPETAPTRADAHDDDVEYMPPADAARTEIAFEDDQLQLSPAFFQRLSALLLAADLDPPPPRPLSAGMARSLAAVESCGRPPSPPSTLAPAPIAPECDFSISVVAI